MCFWCLQVCTKTLRNFTVSLRRCSYLPNIRAFSSAECCNNKRGSFRGKNCVSGQKNKSKKWVFDVSRSVLKHFAFLLYESDDTLTCRIFAHLVVQSVATIKKEFLQEKSSFRSKKLQKNGFLESSGLY